MAMTVESHLSRCVVLLVVSISMPHVASKSSPATKFSCAAVRAHVRSLPTIDALGDDDEVRDMLNGCFRGSGADTDDSYECTIRRDTVKQMFGDELELFERVFSASFPRCRGVSSKSIHESSSPSSLEGICALQRERREPRQFFSLHNRTLRESDSVNETSGNTTLLSVSQDQSRRDQEWLRSKGRDDDDGNQETHVPSERRRRLASCSIPSSGTYDLAGDCSLASTVTVSGATLTVRGVGLQPTIDGGNSARLFKVQSSGTLRIENVHLTNGSASVSVRCDSYVWDASRVHAHSTRPSRPVNAHVVRARTNARTHNLLLDA